MIRTLPIVRAATLALIATGLLAAAPLAQAASQEKLPSAEIDISKIDFASTRAVDHLIRRVHRVALDLCVSDSRYQAGMDSEERTCYDTVVNSGTRQIEGKRQQALRQTSVHIAAVQPEAAPAH